MIPSDRFDVNCWPLNVQITSYTNGLDRMWHSTYTSDPSRIKFRFIFGPNERTSSGTSVVVCAAVSKYWARYKYHPSQERTRKRRISRPVQRSAKFGFQSKRRKEKKTDDEARKESYKNEWREKNENDMKEQCKCYCLVWIWTGKELRKGLKKGRRFCSWCWDKYYKTETRKEKNENIITMLVMLSGPDTIRSKRKEK